jgi:hypothetical protein
VQWDDAGRLGMLAIQLICHAAFTMLCYRSPFCHGVLPLSKVMGFRDKAEKGMIREWLAEACRVSKDAAPTCELDTSFFFAAKIFADHCCIKTFREMHPISYLSASFEATF